MAAGTATQRVSAFSISGFHIWIGILWLIVLQGLYSFVRQTVEGHTLTGLSDAAPWGLYITGFVFFVGASAGATIVGLMIHAFGRDDYAPLGVRAILVGLLSLAAAVLFIAVDVGSIPRMMMLPWLWRNPTSMFMYTSLTYYVFGALLLAELYYTLKVNRGVATATDRRAAKWLAISAVPFALVILHAPHGALFAVVVAREFWNSPLLPPHFAVAALVTGTSLMLLIIIATSSFGRRELVGKDTLAHMGLLLASFIGVSAFLDFFDFLVTGYSNTHATDAAWDILTGSQLGLSIIHVGGLIVAFVILLFPRGRTVPWLTVAAAVALIAIAAYRYNLTTVGVEVPLFTFVDTAKYAPTWIEISITAGIVALVLSVYSVLTRVLPVEESAAATSDEAAA